MRSICNGFIGVERFGFELEKPQNLIALGKVMMAIIEKKTSPATNKVFHRLLKLFRKVLYFNDNRVVISLHTFFYCQQQQLTKYTMVTFIHIDKDWILYQKKE
ncbi:CLUMA_CG013777, isoform A [Clunio marinus]|uniref:CLUMA_CG013777, isoform A n=1 Tax=Clunio marinus TaxID=568069 RepID=A0A1J1ILS6_9DIPT|nr:CLUMA_CG013777, isoform A [Clunio marinus]